MRRMTEAEKEQSIKQIIFQMNPSVGTALDLINHLIAFATNKITMRQCLGGLHGNSDHTVSNHEQRLLHELAEASRKPNQEFINLTDSFDTGV